jgi:hypothetical protein
MIANAAARLVVARRDDAPSPSTLRRVFVVSVFVVAE